MGVSLTMFSSLTDHITVKENSGCQSIYNNRIGEMGFFTKIFTAWKLGLTNMSSLLGRITDGKRFIWNVIHNW